MSMTTFDEEIRARIAPLANPLAGAAPAGSDLSYDAEFERVSAEIEKLSNLTGGNVDWMLVVEDSTRILSERSKDFRLVGWLTVAKAQREGWRGVAEGLFVMQAMVDGFWDTMFPPTKRARARAGVLTWLWESLEKMLAVRAVSAADADAIKALETLVSDLDARLGERLGDLNPGVGRFRSVVREKVRALPAPAPPAPPPPATAPKAEAPPPATNGTNGSAAASAVTAVASPVAVVAPQAAVVAPQVAIIAPPPPVPEAPPLVADVGGSLEELHEKAGPWQEGLLALARAARATAPADPWGYRLLRASIWLTIDAPPDLDTGRRTYIRAPDEASTLADLVDASDWQGLVTASEELFAQYTFWLDLHRFTALGLERLQRTAARDTVVRELVALLARLPGVEELEFRGGMPFASAETRAWLERERARFSPLHAGGTAGAGAGAGASSAGGGAAMAAAVTEALGAARDGTDASMAKLLRAAERADVRSRFVGRLEVAKIALDKERHALALDVAELLLPEVTDTLEAWEPALAAEALASCLSAIQKTSNDEQGPVDGRINLLFRRLLKLDPEAALRLRGT
ncbi:type VI secretion system protein TssA [Pendulispora albinea]|uniref:Type VI secretion system protein TssA n=1 Tax=Pendulispora albinea TaxID=2741071 RepID=A0ABZ2LRV7_9BACT